jgi:5-methylcytosine-specific restriction protein B
VARYTDGRRQLIDPTVERWKEQCLLGEGSLLFDDRDQVWTSASADEMYRRFNENLLEGAEGGGSFDTKWDLQLEGASETVRLFAAELVLIHFLFAMSVTKEGKLRVIRRTLGEGGPPIPEDSQPVGALEEWIGHPGIGFNTRRDLQIAYLIDFARRFKALASDDAEAARQLLDSPWELREFADDTSTAVREMRHILLHLLRPDCFERISCRP